MDVQKGTVAIEGEEWLRQQKPCAASAGVLRRGQADPGPGAALIENASAARSVSFGG